MADRARPARGAFTVDLAVQVPAAETVELLDGGGQAYPRMFAAIAGAQRSIHLEVYSFDSTGIGLKFVDALSNAAHRGVKVRVIIDGWGSARSGRVVASLLRHAGCEVLVYHRLRALLVGRFGRNHRKILLVDDEIAFLGGINIGDAYIANDQRPGWADLAIEIHGPPALRLGQTIRRERRHAGSGTVRINLSGLGGGWRLRRQYVRAFHGARQRILVAHGYFIPDRRIIRSLTAASRRGVEVRLLLAGRSDIPFSRAATRTLYRRFLKAGVLIREWSGSVLHAKVAAVDGRRLLIGSFNLDPFSLANLETLVEVEDAKVVSDGEKWIDERYAASRPITAEEAGGWLLALVGLFAVWLASTIGRLLDSRRRE